MYDQPDFGQDPLLEVVDYEEEIQEINPFSLSPHQAAKLQNDQAMVYVWERHLESKKHHRPIDRVKRHCRGSDWMYVECEDGEIRLFKNRRVRLLSVKGRQSKADDLIEEQFADANAEFEDMMTEANDAMDWREDNDLYENQYSR